MLAATLAATLLAVGHGSKNRPKNALGKKANKANRANRANKAKRRMRKPHVICAIKTKITCQPIRHMMMTSLPMGRALRCDFVGGARCSTVYVFGGGRGQDLPKAGRFSSRALIRILLMQRRGLGP